MIRQVILSGILILATSNVYAQTAKLSWNANTESDLAGYKLYYGSASGVYGDPVDIPLSALSNTASPTFTQTLALDCGENKTAFFALTAYDLAGNESGKSNEVSKTYDVSPCNPTLLDVIALLEEQNQKLDKLLNAKFETRIVP
ncbi:MAG: hypothetical protein ACE5IR_26040 [bacterium]